MMTLPRLGRPPKDATIRAQLLASLQEGVSVKDACRAARVGRASFYAWRASDPEFAAAVESTQAAGAGESNGTQGTPEPASQCALAPAPPPEHPELRDLLVLCQRCSESESASATWGTQADNVRATWVRETVAARAPAEVPENVLTRLVVARASVEVLDTLTSAYDSEFNKRLVTLTVATARTLRERARSLKLVGDSGPRGDGADRTGPLDRAVEKRAAALLTAADDFEKVPGSTRPREQKFEAAIRYTRMSLSADTT